MRSELLARILSTTRYSGRICRHIPKGLPSQIRLFSDVHPASQSTPQPEQPVQPPNTSAGSRSVEFSYSPTAELEEHLSSVFAPLRFPPELAARILTHASHPDAIHRHNARLSFIGRRVLQSYLMLFLHGTPPSQSSYDYLQVTMNTLNTYVLGEHVAPKWSLGDVIKWRPARTRILTTDGSLENLEHVKSDPGLSIGLYKVQGTTVEALVGGVFHQFGGSIAHRLFHTRLLPHILLPGTPEGLPDVFHQHALEVCEKMGGPTGDLLVPQ